MEIGDIVVYNDKKYVVVNTDHGKFFGIKEIDGSSNLIFVTIDDLEPPIFPSDKK